MYMAAIDKIYATKEQREELIAYLQADYPEALCYIYEWYEEWDYDEREHPISNFPVEVDQYLMLNCPIPWVVAYIRSQYGLE